MMPGKAAKIQVTERQFEILEEIVASHTAAVRLVQRAKIVLLAFAKHNNEEVGEIVGLNPQQASVWRKRWRDDWQRLISIECNEPRCVLKNEIETLLADKPRKGRASKFTPEQQAVIVSSTSQISAKCISAERNSVVRDDSPVASVPVVVGKHSWADGRRGGRIGC
jgi:hypothetical protein